MQCKRQTASPAARFLPVGRSCTGCGVAVPEPLRQHRRQADAARTGRIRGPLCRRAGHEPRRCCRADAFPGAVRRAFYTGLRACQSGRRSRRGRLGPGWLLSIRPKGYVQGEIRETTQSLSINTTRYSAVLQLSVTVNMILDGSTATLTVAADYPLASLLVCGDIPNAYASDLD